MSDARRHAVTASELLALTERLTEQLDALTDDERLQMIVTGGMEKSNTDLHWTVEVATAHAVTALALAATEQERDA